MLFKLENKKDYKLKNEKILSVYINKVLNLQPEN